MVIVEHMTMTNVDFATAVKIANEAGLNGCHVELQWVPPTQATQLEGVFIAAEYVLTGAGTRVYL